MGALLLIVVHNRNSYNVNNCSELKKQYCGQAIRYLSRQAVPFKIFVGREKIKLFAERKKFGE
jgi:hypothetical protein